MVTQAVADVMSPGDHGSTFAGNPLVCHAAEAVVDIITEEGFLQDVTRKGEKLRAGLESALSSNPHVKQVRGLGLIVGIQLDVVSTRTKQLCLTCLAVVKYHEMRAESRHWHSISLQPWSGWHTPFAGQLGFNYTSALQSGQNASHMQCEPTFACVSAHHVSKVLAVQATCVIVLPGALHPDCCCMSVHHLVCPY